MVYASRRAVVKIGKLPDAIKWAKEVAKYINDKYGTDYNVYTQMIGESPISVIYWIGKLDSVNKYFELLNVMMEDQEYLAKIADASTYLIDGMIYDALLMKH